MPVAHSLLFNHLKYMASQGYSLCAPLRQISGENAGNIVYADICQCFNGQHSLFFWPFKLPSLILLPEEDKQRLVKTLHFSKLFTGESPINQRCIHSNRRQYNDLLSFYWIQCREDSSNDACFLQSAIHCFLYLSIVYVNCLVL